MSEIEVVENRDKLIRKARNKWRQRREPQTYGEAIDRLDEFFAFCEQLGVLETLEDLYLCLGITRSTAWRWLNGKSRINDPRWADALQRAIDAIRAATVQAGNERKIDAVRSIWIEKSRFHYSESESVEDKLARQERLERSYQLPGDILKKYSQLEDKTVSDAISQPTAHYSKPEPVESHLSATKPLDFWMDIPEIGEDLDNLPFGIEDD